jgi:hypothetical protein
MVEEEQGRSAGEGRVIPRPLFLKALALIALAIAALAGVQRYVDRQTEQARLDGIATGAAGVIATVDTVYARDTADFRTKKRRYEQARDTAETFEELTEALVEADHALQSCTLVMASCESRVAARDSLIRALMRPKKQPLVRPWVEGLYDPAAKQFVPRAGADVRLPHDLSLTVAGEIADKPRVLVGIRKSW